MSGYGMFPVDAEAARGLLWEIKSGHAAAGRPKRLLLSEVKRTSSWRPPMSQFDP